MYNIVFTIYIKIRTDRKFFSDPNAGKQWGYKFCYDIPGGGGVHTQRERRNKPNIRQSELSHIKLLLILILNIV